MPDREKVLLALEHHKETMVCNGCPYAGDDDTPQGNCPVYDDAIALLNGQTAQWIWDRPHHFRCSGCNGVVGQMIYLYCPNCGREMLLSETERRKEWPEEVSGDD